MLMNSRFSAIEMVLLEVGDEEIEISVHENVLFEASPVFKTAFASKFKESSERSIYLPDDDADLMDALIQNLYAPQSGFREIGSTMELLRLYVLADKYDTVQVKNRICDWLLSHLKPLPPSAIEVEFVYGNTTSERPVRRLMVDWFMWRIDAIWFDKEENRRWLKSVPEFAVDVCGGLANTFSLRGKLYPLEKKSAFYWEKEPEKDPKHIKEQS